MILNNPKNGEILETSLTLVAARDILQASPLAQSDPFVKSLLQSYPHFRGAQLFWFYKKAEQINNPTNSGASARESVTVGAGFLKIHQMFAHAAQTLKHPKIRLVADDEREIPSEIVLSLASATSRNPNHVYVKLNGEYVGKVSPDGAFFPTNGCPEFVKAFLREFADDPAKIAAAYGHRFGSCCFCARELTDKRSVFVGYGPICADKFNLPWGEGEGVE